MALGELLAWTVIGVFVGIVLGAAVAVLWAPFLRAPAVRRAVVGGPLRWWANYLLAFAVLGAVHATTVAVLLAVMGSRATLPDIAVGVPLLVGLGGALVLVRAMDGEDVLQVYVVVMGGVLWYVLVTLGLTFLAVAWFLPFS